MAEASIGAIRPVIPGATGVQPDGRFGHHGGHQPRRRRAPARLVQALIPGGDEDSYEVVYDVQDGQFFGVIVRHRETGAVLRTVPAEDLGARDDRPGLILERQG